MSVSSDMKFFIYDLETLINFFSFAGKFRGDDRVYTFELSPRKNQRNELLSFLNFIQQTGAQMVGFNSLQFDYVILADLLNNPYTFDYTQAYNLCQRIIGSQRYGDAGLAYIQMKDRLIPQIDLVKVNHFDNVNKRTPLKSLQCAMRSESVEDLPVEIGVPLTYEQMDETLKYNIHDVTETEKFLEKCMHLIDLRRELLDTGVLTGDVLNFSDVKIGSEYFIKKLGRAACFINGATPRQTLRSVIDFKDVVLPKIYYRSEPFNEVLEWFKKQKVYVGGNPDLLPKLSRKFGGIDFHFGVGGVHASVESKKFETNDEYIIKDVDVEGMYPAVATANDFAPEHLGKLFSDIYKQAQKDRKLHKKGTAMNKVLKLANNGVFGNSDNKFSCFYDPKVPKQITINGQLQILQLSELMTLIPGTQLIQANTDGITLYLRREHEDLFKMWCANWEAETGLKLEHIDYKKMWIRDVNNYLAEGVDGKIKRKGAYWYPVNDEDYDGTWNKDFSNMAAIKGIELVLTKNLKPETAIKLVSDKFDFMLRYKTPSGAKVYLGDKVMQKTVRYYVSKNGQPMKKIANPKGEIGQYKRARNIPDDVYESVMKEIGKNVWDERIHTKTKGKYELVETSIESGWLIKECNIASKFDWTDVDFDYYIKEIEKLRIG